MTTTTSGPGETISLDTWKTACTITESQQEAKDLVQDIFDELHYLPDDKREMAVMLKINLLASKVMTRH